MVFFERCRILQRNFRAGNQNGKIVFTLIRRCWLGVAMLKRKHAECLCIVTQSRIEDAPRLELSPNSSSFNFCSATSTQHKVSGGPIVGKHGPLRSQHWLKETRLDWNVFLACGMRENCQCFQTAASDCLEGANQSVGDGGVRDNDAVWSALVDLTGCFSCPGKLLKTVEVPEKIFLWP